MRPQNEVVIFTKHGMKEEVLCLRVPLEIGNNLSAATKGKPHKAKTIAHAK